MKNKIPITEEKELSTILSEDTIEELVSAYNIEVGTVNGKTISDVSIVFEKLTEWDTIERLDLIIPFQFSHKRKESKGYRFWYLSRPQNNRYYHGNFFDQKVLTTEKKSIVKQYRLSKEAINFFSLYKEVRENKEIVLKKDEK